MKKIMAKSPEPELAPSEKLKRLRDEENRIKKEREALELQVADALIEHIDMLIRELADMGRPGYRLLKPDESQPQPSTGTSSGKKGRKAGTKMSEAAKAKMREAAKERWAAKKAAQPKSEEKAATA